MHGREEEAEQVVSSIEEHVKEATDRSELPEAQDEIELQPRKRTGFGEIARTMFGKYPKRSILGFTLMSTQAFIYNATVFTFTAGLATSTGSSRRPRRCTSCRSRSRTSSGALLLGRFFDTIGRRVMISSTYAISAVGLVAAGILFTNDSVSLGVFVAILCATFFFASAAASAGYLTISETFPIEIRAMAIAFFFAISTGIGGAVGPLVFGKMIESGDRDQLLIGYLCRGAHGHSRDRRGILGVDAEQETLEDVAEPLAVRGGGACLVHAGARSGRRRWSRRRGRGHRPRPRDRRDRQAPEGEGPARRTHEIRRELETRFWGPGRLRGALVEARRRGLVRRIGRRTFEIAD